MPTPTTENPVDAGANDEKTALHYAAWGGHAKAVQALVAAGADVNAQAHHGRFALHWAGLSGCAEAVQALLAAGADVHAKNNDGRTALHEAGRERGAEALRALLAAGANVHVITNNDRTALHFVAWNDGSKAVEVVLEAGADVHIIDQDGWSPLHCAVSRGNTFMVAALLHRGAHPTATILLGVTPLCMAVTLGHRAIMDLLPAEHPPDATSTPALEAVRYTRLGMLDHAKVRPFLHTADKDAGDRVLHIASRRANRRAVVALLRRGADARRPNAVDETPLAAALKWLTDLLARRRAAAALNPDTRPDIPLRVVATGHVVRRRRGAEERATVSDADRECLDDWRVVVLALLCGGADTLGMSSSAVALCARVVASVPWLGPRQAARLAATRRIKPPALDAAVVIEELD
eukprot:TRINITY_DN217_c0_g1_i4.p2 TRINITY_DN217_c0_g1~~TRINITY_DN217_c0_g1_i4.p2  ORF type:complete len:407 (-),score=128.62 TRINITY_DN217_c0_g1_i4:206-1426(-)